MVILSHGETAVRIKEEQPFDGFDILYCKMSQLAIQLPIQNKRGTGNKQQQNRRENEDIPDCQPRSKREGPEPPQVQTVSSRKMKPRPLTV